MSAPRRTSDNSEISISSTTTTDATNKALAIPFHIVPLNDDSTTAEPDRSVVRALGKGGVDPHVGQAILRGMILLFGLASVAQFSVACAFFIKPLSFSIALQNEHKSVGLTLLPTIANITNKVSGLALAGASAVRQLIDTAPLLLCPRRPTSG